MICHTTIKHTYTDLAMSRQSLAIQKDIAVTKRFEMMTECTHICQYQNMSDWTSSLFVLDGSTLLVLRTQYFKIIRSISWLPMHLYFHCRPRKPRYWHSSIGRNSIFLTKHANVVLCFLVKMQHYMDSCASYAISDSFAHSITLAVVVLFNLKGSIQQQNMVSIMQSIKSEWTSMMKFLSNMTGSSWES